MMNIGYLKTVKLEPNIKEYKITPNFVLGNISVTEINATGNTILQSRVYDEGNYQFQVDEL